MGQPTGAVSSHEKQPVAPRDIAALARKGLEFDLFERASAFKPVGAGIALMPPALRVAEQLRGSAPRTLLFSAEPALVHSTGQDSP